jgi:hypothetical protein
MIVRHLGEHIILITQPDHAHLAARVMSEAVGLNDHPRRTSILIAVAEHDAGWAVEDASPRVDPSLGVVLDFIHIADDVRQGVWPRSIAMLTERDRWSAALVAQHAITVYAHMRQSGQWGDFFTTIAELRDELLLDTGGRLEDLESDYAYVRLGDLISLCFCTGSDRLSQFGEWTVTRRENGVHVTPDPFGEVRIPVSVSAMEIPAKKYRSDDELRDVLSCPRIVTLHGVVEGLPSP